MTGFFLFCATVAALGVPFDIQDLAKRADACSSVWGASRAASNTKFTSLDIEEKREATLSTNRCSTLARNVINTCLKYQQDVNLKKICTHLLVQSAEVQPPPAPAPINLKGPNAPAVAPVVAAPVMAAPPKPNPVPSMNAMPGSGIAPATASGAAMTGTMPSEVVPTPVANQIEPNISPVPPTFGSDTNSSPVSRETASPPAAP